MTVLSTAEKVVAFRESGWVDRMHTVIKQRSYRTGEHQWNVANLIILLFPNDVTVDLIKAGLWHDVPERWVGDSPYPAKYPMTGNKLAEVLHQAEDKVDHYLNCNVDLDERGHGILKICDMLELILWAHEELKLGNVHIQGTFNNGMRAITYMALWDEIKDTVNEILACPNTEDSSWWKELMDNAKVRK
jgi:5'-deoxynucleotidase YfbR-like HD superfamily hydrolase